MDDLAQRIATLEAQVQGLAEVGVRITERQEQRTMREDVINMRLDRLEELNHKLLGLLQAHLSP